MKISEILERVGDAPSEFGHRLSQFNHGNFQKVSGRLFAQAVSRITQNDLARGDAAKGLDTLHVYSVTEYNSMKCFIGKNNSSGYAIAHGNELVSVFSSQGSTGSAIMKDAIQNGVTRLDCFAIRNKDGSIEGGSHTLYSRHGFSIDVGMNSGEPGQAYAIQNGVSDYVDDSGNVHPDDPRVVIFMKR